MTAPASTERPLRADAARNRARVLAGAKRAFAEEGLHADMASVAKRAGVGVGTVYRHFPTKDALTAALAVEHFERLAGIVEDIEATVEDPAEAFEALVWRCATATVDDHGMCEILASLTPSGDPGPPSERLREATARVVARARDAGALRPDAEPTDVPMIMCGFGRLAALQREGAPVDWERYLRIAIDGMRARPGA